MSHVPSRWIAALALATACAAGAAADDGLAARVERAAADAAQAHVAAPDRFEVSSSRFAGSDAGDRPGLELRLAEVAGPNASGVVRVRYRLIAGDRALGEARATVRGRRRGPALVARRTLLRGRPVAASDVARVDADLTRLAELPAREPGDVLGLVPLRTLGRDRVLTPGLLGPAPVVHRGMPVDLRVERGAVRVTAPGRALRAGAPGEVVPAENRTTGVRVEGVVQPDGSLLVVRGAVPDRS